MGQKTITVATLILNLVLVLSVLNGKAAEDMAMDSNVHHDLTIVLFPDTSELEGRDRMRIRRPQHSPLNLMLAPHAQLKSVQVNGREHPYTFSQGRLIVRPDRKPSIPSLDLSIHYTCRFDDPAPQSPVNTDNPGFGVSGTISTAGSFILSGAGWYPRLTGARESFDLQVTGPQETVAVTAGRLVGITHQDKRTVSRWRIDNALEGLSLSAGPYVVQRQTEGNVSVATYLFPKNRQLSPRYLEASLRHLKRYSDLLGPYPYDGFAVVENFFPTGYGFPSYTLMGGMVLRLPFIPETSLPHEIVHNWWGNGVLVDFASGNWCEGLASYTADYLIKEQTSDDAAMDYRRQALRNYASLVSESTDFPLNRFRSRTDPATKAVGYDKAAMVFHMLRQAIGDTVFWDALRDFYARFQFKRASWQDLQQIFEKHAGQSLDEFFQQWITRAGAPRIHLENVRQVPDKGSYRTTGHLVQEKPYYDVTLQLVLDTEGNSVTRSVRLSDRKTAFDIQSAQRPLKLTADPDYHLFRRLAREEMPPTINTLKGSTSVVLVVADRLGRHGPPIARRFSRAMGMDPVRWVSESEFSPAEADGKHLLFIGLPEKPDQIDLLPRDLNLGPNAFKLEGQPFSGQADVLFFVTQNPARPENVVSLLHLLSADSADRVTVKIPHYGRYSYLAFSNGRNRIKGTWNVEKSPMMVQLITADTP